MSAVHCQVCSTAEPTQPTAVTVPMTGSNGKPLDKNAVHFLCRKCRQAAAYAEKAAKKEKAREEP